MFLHFPHLETFTLIHDSFTHELDELHITYAPEVSTHAFMHMFLLSQSIFLQAQLSEKAETVLAYLLAEDEVIKMREVYEKYNFIDEEQNFTCLAQEFNIFCLLSPFKV